MDNNSKRFNTEFINNVNKVIKHIIITCINDQAFRSILTKHNLLRDNGNVNFSSFNSLPSKPADLIRLVTTRINLIYDICNIYPQEAARFPTFLFHNTIEKFCGVRKIILPEIIIANTLNRFIIDPRDIDIEWYRNGFYVVEPNSILRKHTATCKNMFRASAVCDVCCAKSQDINLSKLYVKSTRNNIDKNEIDIEVDIVEIKNILAYSSPRKENKYYMLSDTHGNLYGEYTGNIYVKPVAPHTLPAAALSCNKI